MALPGQKESSLLSSKIGYIEVLSPGVAYTWTDDATGIKIRTNLKASDCNRRPGDKDGIVYFKTDNQLWKWALRVRSMTERGGGLQ